MELCHFCELPILECRCFVPPADRRDLPKRPNKPPPMRRIVRRLPDHPAQNQRENEAMRPAGVIRY